MSTSLLVITALGALGGCVIPSQQDTVVPKRVVETPKISPEATANTSVLDE